MKVARGELLRKIVHMAVGLIALSLRFLTPLQAAAMALAALLFNLYLLPRLGGKRLWREGEAASGRSLGIVFYPLAVLLLILVFARRLEVAAAVWGILAFGDGMASLIGMTLGGAKLPWNPDKSWSGSLAYVVFGTAGAVSLLMWTAPGRYAALFALTVCFVTATVSALIESLPLGLDDNLRVPLVAGLLLFCLLLGEGGYAALLAPEQLGRLGVGAGVNVALGLGALAAGAVDLSGFLVGGLLGAGVWWFLGWRAFVLFAAFVLGGSLVTKIGYRRKADAKLAQEKGGRRGARHALANTGTAFFCALFAAVTPYPRLFGLAFAGALATALADTCGSEIGQLWGRRTFLITTLKPVPRGTDGAVSVEGTAAGIVGSLVVAALGAWGGLYPAWPGIAVIVIAAFLGTTLESLFGALLEQRGLLDNEAINFLNTLVGALLAFALGYVWLSA
jgi:uncharacterized protein (TIGR00297 family)